MTISQEHIIKVFWDGVLLISKGDEIEILRGKGRSENSVRASLLKNLTNGRTERSYIEGIFDTSMPVDLQPPIHGIVKEIVAGDRATSFDLVEGVGILEGNLTKLLKEITPCLDKEIVEKCIHKKDTEDIVTSAYRILEERIRKKINVGYDRSGVELVCDAFNPKTGKLFFGETDSEREGLFHLYRGSMMLWRNPSAHRFVKDYNEFETLEIVIHVNLLLNILDKCYEILRTK